MIPLEATPTELSTAASDLAVAVAAVAGVAWLGARRRQLPGRLWSASLVALAAAALGGAAVHGLVLAAAWEAALWRATTLALAATVVTFALGVLAERGGAAAVRRALPALLALVAVATVATELAGGSFLPTVALEGAVMVPTFALCLQRALARRERGPALLAVGLGATLVAALLQALGVGAFRLLWEFDHNGLFHLLQLAALVPLVAGMRRCLDDARTPPAMPY